MKRNWSDDKLDEQWSLSSEELTLLPNRVGHNRFGFAVQLKFFQIEGRFPRSPREVPAAALRYLAHQLGLSINIFQKYDWRGRARKDHRTAIREYLGFRAFTAADGARLDDWLFHELVPSGVCSGYVRFFITSAQRRAVADTFDDVPDHTAPGLGTDTPMNIAHA
jgi:hypothetical protein